MNRNHPHGFLGIYVCPLCSGRKEVTLPYKREHLSLILRLAQNKFLNSPRAFCLNCQRPSFLEKILDHQRHLIFDARQWFRYEISRLQHFRNYN